jgi:alpha-mannosidase
MNNDKKESIILIGRYKKWLDRAIKNLVITKKDFEAEYAWSKEATPFNEKSKLKYKPIKKDANWGKKWESAWFHLKGEIPKSWKGKTIVAELDFSGEGLIYNAKGDALQGITSGAIWDPNFLRKHFIISDKCKGGEKINLWVEAAANHIFGIYQDPDPSINNPKRHGWFDAKVKQVEFGIFDPALWHLCLDVQTLLGLIEKLEIDSVQRSRIIKILSDALIILGDDYSKVNEARKILKKELNKKASASDLNVTAIGHAHIDTGWLWPVKETIRKCARTFSTQLALMRKYPKYKFGASQPQHYQFVKDHYPKIYSEVKKAVKKGQWELQGGMWVEADCNLISGESMVRQILHGKNFFMDEFSVNVNNLWLPDVFGYSAALPQILQKTGIKYFLTQKLSWSQFNEFPHHTFNWRGIDGSEILTHFPPENTYNSTLETSSLIPAQKNFKEKDKIDEFISLFGVGNGGGGPKPEHIEFGLRAKNLESVPKLKFGTAKNFFDRLSKYESKLETWVGELYLELHRGTLTTHAPVKRNNRKLEWKIRATEILWSCNNIKKYPSKELDKTWKKILINQFHDIIPGSSINLVYQTTYKEYEEIHNNLDALISKAGENLFKKSEDHFVLANTLSCFWDGPYEIPNSFNGFKIFDEQNNQVPMQKTSNGICIDVNIPPLSFSTYKIEKSSKIKLNKNESLTLENDLIKYKFNKKGNLTSAYDKELKTQLIDKTGNILSLYEDRPNDWDAWDIDFFYRDMLLENAKLNNYSIDSSGSIKNSINFTLTVGKSSIKQNISLGNHSKKLNFITKVDWKESHKMLRVKFPVKVQSDTASFDIQYGYVKRNTHRNTSWDKAKFEVLGHKYADLSNNDFGVALMNDCKYGYMVHDNTIDLNLLRAPKNPDPDADQGIHHFTYSFLPHSGDLINSNVINESTKLNQSPIMFDKVRANVSMPISLKGDNIELSVLKKAEKENDLIVRVYETHGTHTKGKLSTKGHISECDMMEWDKVNRKSFKKSDINFKLAPFEIKTFRVKLNS